MSAPNALTIERKRCSVKKTVITTRSLPGYLVCIRTRWALKVESIRKQAQSSSLSFNFGK